MSKTDDEEAAAEVKSHRTAHASRNSLEEFIIAADIAGRMVRLEMYGDLLQR